MNSITMKMQADQLIRMALQEDITSEDVSTNAVMPTEVKGTQKKTELSPDWMSMQEFFRCWMRKRKLILNAKTVMR